MVYLDEPETPDTVESAFLDLDEREVGMTGAVGGSSTCVLGRFWKKPHPPAGLSGSGLAGRGERLVLENFGSVRNFTSKEREVNMTYCAGEGVKGTKPGGGSETTATGGGCTGGVSRFGNGRLCASSALSISC